MRKQGRFNAKSITVLSKEPKFTSSGAYELEHLSNVQLENAADIDLANEPKNEQADKVYTEGYISQYDSDKGFGALDDGTFFRKAVIQNAADYALDVGNFVYKAKYEKQPIYFSDELFEASELIILGEERKTNGLALTNPSEGGLGEGEKQLRRTTITRQIKASYAKAILLYT